MIVRSIKFRAWDKKSKKMREVESIGFGTLNLSYKIYNYPVCNMKGYDIIEQKDITVHRDSPHFELMLYTGKEDINKKEVYEGDIVKQFADINELGNNLYFFYQIKWDDKYARFYGEEIYSKETFLFDELEDIEVIGNIFDNPELLQIRRNLL